MALSGKVELQLYISIQLTPRDHISNNSNGFFAAGVIVGMVILSVLFSGFVLQVLWSWFVAKTFGLPELNIPQALGLVIIFQAFLPAPKETSSVPFISAAMMLGVGWVVHLFL